MGCMLNQTIRSNMAQQGHFDTQSNRLDSALETIPSLVKEAVKEAAGEQYGDIVSTSALATTEAIHKRLRRRRTRERKNRMLLRKRMSPSSPPPE